MQVRVGAFKVTYLRLGVLGDPISEFSNRSNCGQKGGPRDILSLTFSTQSLLRLGKKFLENFSLLSVELFL